jgi:hypothetical protein
MMDWKECKHEVVDVVALHDQATLYSLRDYGILRFFKSQNMRSHSMLLQRLI